MIYLIIGIILITIILFLIFRDINKLIRLSSTITIISGYLTILFGLIIRSIINNKFSLINISKITNPLFSVSINRGLILLLIGSIELIIYTVIRIYNRYNLVN